MDKKYVSFFFINIGKITPSIVTIWHLVSFVIITIITRTTTNNALQQ